MPSSSLAFAASAPLLQTSSAGSFTRTFALRVRVPLTARRTINRPAVVCAQAQGSPPDSSPDVSGVYQRVDDQKSKARGNVYQFLAILWTLLELSQPFFSSVPGISSVLSWLRAPTALSLLMVFSALRAASQHDRLSSTTYRRLNLFAVLYALARLAIFAGCVVADPSRFVLMETTGNVTTAVVIIGAVLMAIPVFFGSLVTFLTATWANLRNPPIKAPLTFPSNALSKAHCFNAVALFVAAAAGIVAFTYSLPFAASSLPAFSAVNGVIHSVLPALASKPEILEHLGVFSAGALFEGGISMVLSDAANRGRLSAATFSDLSAGFVVASLARLVVLGWAVATGGLSSAMSLWFVVPVALLYGFNNVVANASLAKRKAETA